MKTIEVTMKMEVDDDFYDDLKRIVDHHVDYLLDLISYPEIHSVYGAKIQEIDNQQEMEEPDR